MALINFDACSREALQKWYDFITFGGRYLYGAAQTRLLFSRDNVSVEMILEAGAVLQYVDLRLQFLQNQEVGNFEKCREILNELNKIYSSFSAEVQAFRSLPAVKDAIEAGFPELPSRTTIANLR